MLSNIPFRVKRRKPTHPRVKPAHPRKKTTNSHLALYIHLLVICLVICLVLGGLLIPTAANAETSKEGDIVNNHTTGTFILADQIPSEEQIYFYKNPSRINNIGDPFIIQDRETGLYTLIATSANIGYFGWNSEDLIHWDNNHWAYQRPINSWSTDSYWAPEIVYYRGLYYMFYTARQQNGRLTISVAVSEQAEGPYKDVQNTPVFDLGYAIIDGSVFIDDDDTPYFYYVKDVSENWFGQQRVSVVYGVELNEDLLSFKGEPVELLRPDQAWENPYDEWTWNEGPITMKHDGTYYLAYSANYFESPAYSVGYATSENPLGPFVKAEENPILTAGTLQGISGSGHHSYINSPDHSELFAVYHTHTIPQNPTGNRQVAMDRVSFKDDGSMHIAGPTMSWIPVPSNERVKVLQPKDYISATNAMNDTLNSLVDGILAIHAEDNEQRCLNVAPGEQYEIQLKLQEAHDIQGLTLVAGADHRANLDAIEVIMEDRVYHLGNFDSDSPENHTLSGIFSEAVLTDLVTLRFTSGAKDSNTCLSEIYLIAMNSED